MRKEIKFEIDNSFDSKLNDKIKLDLSEKCTSLVVYGVEKYINDVPIYKEVAFNASKNEIKFILEKFLEEINFKEV